MAYVNENVLIARPAASNLAGWFDKIKSYAEKGAGAAADINEALHRKTATPDATSAPAGKPPSSGPSTTTLILGGVAVVGILGVLAFKRKKK